MKKLFVALQLLLLVLVFTAAPEARGRQAQGEATQPAEPAQRSKVEQHEESVLAGVFRWANFLILFGGLG